VETAPPIQSISPVLAALNIQSHQTSPETQYELARAAAEMWVAMINPDHRETLHSQWSTDPMRARLLGQILSELSGEGE
jgi:hypothetical protein